MELVFSPLITIFRESNADSGAGGTPSYQNVCCNTLCHPEFLT